MTIAMTEDKKKKMVEELIEPRASGEPIREDKKDKKKKTKKVKNIFGFYWNYIDSLSHI